MSPRPSSDPETGPLVNLSNMLENCVVVFINSFYLITMTVLVLSNLFGCNKQTLNKIQVKHSGPEIIISDGMMVFLHVCEEKLCKTSFMFYKASSRVTELAL